MPGCTYTKYTSYIRSSYDVLRMCEVYKLWFLLRICEVQLSRRDNSTSHIRNRNLKIYTSHIRSTSQEQRGRLVLGIYEVNYLIRIYEVGNTCEKRRYASLRTCEVIQFLIPSLYTPSLTPTLYTPSEKSRYASHRICEVIQFLILTLYMPSLYNRSFVDRLDFVYAK